LNLNFIENLGSTRKSVEIYIKIACITNLILAIHRQSVNGLEEPFQHSRKKSSSPCAAGVTLQRKR
jgi:hypothetical protein